LANVQADLKDIAVVGHD
jgi:hypothetical protein